MNQKLFWSNDDRDVLRAIREGYIATHYAMWREQGKRSESIKSVTQKLKKKIFHCTTRNTTHSVCARYVLCSSLVCVCVHDEIYLYERETIMDVKNEWRHDRLGLT